MGVGALFSLMFCHLNLQVARLLVPRVHHKDERWMLGPTSTTKMKDGCWGTLMLSGIRTRLGGIFVYQCEQSYACCLSLKECGAVNSSSAQGMSQHGMPSHCVSSIRIVVRW